MRRALVVALLLSACATPSGTAVEICDGSWREVDSVIVQPRDGEARSVPIDCMREVGDQRVRIGFAMPAGPACYALTAIDVVEAADAVSITLFVTPQDDPAAGACPEDPGRTSTEIDLQAPVAERSLLDGSTTTD